MGFKDGVGGGKVREEFGLGYGALSTGYEGFVGVHGIWFLMEVAGRSK